MHYNYARQKLWEAVSVLVGDGSIQQRLTFAATYLILLKPTDLPEGLHLRFAEVYKVLTKTPLSTASAYVPRSLDEVESDTLAHEVLALFSTLQLIQVSGGAQV